MMTVKLSNGYEALVDDQDFDLVSKFRWYGVRDGASVYAYASTKTYDGRPTTVKMHRLLCGHWKIVDHADGNGLNNQRSNLRDGAGGKNGWNRKRLSATNLSGFKGVNTHRKSNRYLARIHFGGKGIYLGSFATPIEAAMAYDKAAIEMFGEYASINFPNQEQ